jgi:hypothetical protein
MSCGLTPQRGGGDFAGVDAAFGVPKIVGRLQVEPQPRTLAAKLSEPHRHFRRHWSRIAPRDDAVKRLPRDAKFRRCVHDRESKRGQHIVAQDFAGMRGQSFVLRLHAIQAGMGRMEARSVPISRFLARSS